jgi:hypothetical protein
MNFHLHSPTETSLGALAAAAIALAAVAMLAGGFLPEDDAAQSSDEQGLVATLDRLGFAHAFAFDEVVQAASSAVRTRVSKALPRQATI